MELAQEYLSKVDEVYTSAGAPSAVEDGIRALLDTYKSEHNDHDIVYASLLNELGAFYRGSKRFVEGEESFSAAAAILRGLGEEFEPELATTLNNLAELYRLDGHLKQAEELLHESLDIFSKAPNDQVVPYASALNYLGHIAMDKERYEEALTYYERSRDLLKSTQAPLVMLTTAYGNLATVFVRMANMYKALEVLDSAKAQLTGTEAEGSDGFKVLMEMRELIAEQVEKYDVPLSVPDFGIG